MLRVRPIRTFGEEGAPREWGGEFVPVPIERAEGARKETIVPAPNSRTAETPEVCRLGARLEKLERFGAELTMRSGADRVRVGEGAEVGRRSSPPACPSHALMVVVKRELHATPRTGDADVMTALAFFSLGPSELVVVLLAALWAWLGPKRDRDEVSEG